MAFVSLLQFCTTAYALSGEVYVGYGSEDPNYDPTLLLIVSGAEVLVLIISAFISFIISTDLKCCFCCCINVDRQCRHGGTYINLLNEIVISDFTRNNSPIKDPPAVTAADNAVSGHPKYVKDYMRIKCGSEEEERILQELLRHHHERLYTKAFPSSTSALLTLTGAQINLLDQFYSLELNRKFEGNEMELGVC